MARSEGGAYIASLCLKNHEQLDFLYSCANFLFVCGQTLQMGIKHFSGLFVMLCVGVALSLLTTMAEHAVYKLVIPRVHEPRFKYWLHTSQVRWPHAKLTS